MKKFLCVFLALFTLMLTGCGGVKEVYSGEGYELSYDSGKWNIAFEANDGTVCFTRNNFDEVSFGVDRYVPEEKVSLAERLEALKEICEAYGYIWDSGEVLNIDGMEWYRAEYQQELGENKFKYVIISTDNDIYVYTVTFTSDIDSFGKCIKEFEEIFDSFKITE